MAVPGNITLICGGRVVVGGGAITSQVTFGGVIFTRAGAGLFDATLSDGGIDSTEISFDWWTEGAAMVTLTLTHTSDTVKRISAFDNAGSAIDNIPFGCKFWRINR